MPFSPKVKNWTISFSLENGELKYEILAALIYQQIRYSMNDTLSIFGKDTENLKKVYP